MTERLKEALNVYSILTEEIPEERKENFVKCFLETDPKVSIQYVESLLSYLKSKKLEIETKIIPEEFQESGISELTLTNGKKVSIQTEWTTKINDKEAWFNFLESKGMGSVIKTQFKFDKGENLEEVKKELINSGIIFSETREIHPQTLKKTIKDYIQDGGDLPEESIAKITPFTHAVIKEGKNE